MRETEIRIGTWHEREARELTHCPSYYAADVETLRIVPGDYPARLSFRLGYTVPMPGWLLVKIDAVRLDGRLYSGFGGLNFGCTTLPKGEAVKHGVQAYAYEIAKFVEDGRLTLAPGFEWLVCGPGEVSWMKPAAPKNWDEVRKLQQAGG